LRGGMNDLCCKARSPVVAKRRVIARKQSEGGGKSRSRTSRPEFRGKFCKRLGGWKWLSVAVLKVLPSWLCVLAEEGRLFLVPC
jgi:hypothetical protein